MEGCDPFKRDEIPCVRDIPYELDGYGYVGIGKEEGSLMEGRDPL